MPTVEIPFVVEVNYAGWRLDRYLQEKLGRASRAQVQRLIKEALIQDGPRRLKASTPVSPGMTIRLRKEEVPEPGGLPDALPILFDDGEVLVVDKPAGLPVHPTARYFMGTATTILGRDHRDAEGRRPDPAHRLDRETSGALVCGRTPAITRRLKALFAPGDGAPKVEKRYLAICEGHPTWDEKRIAHPLALLGEHAVRIRMSIVAADHPEARPAVTVARVKARYTGEGGAPFALLACTLETGRQHQIRAHLHAEGHPIVGDKIYGPDESIFIRFTEGALTEADRRRLRLDRHALHAAELCLPHPRTGERLDLEAPLPEDLQDFLAHLDQAP
jgi:23S rRNA pseudouridine1911/1915/1917 synthase